MNTLWQMPAVVFAVLAWLTAPPSGLADIAEREAFRRAASQRSQASLTNLGLPGDAVPSSAVSMPEAAAPPPSGDSGAKPADQTAKAADPAAAAKNEPPREEGWWRTKITELRAAVDKDQLAVDALQSRINALQADAVNIDDPVKQTRARLDLVRAIDELDKTKKQLDLDRQAVATLQEDARRRNIPPGWIR